MNLLAPRINLKDYRLVRNNELTFSDTERLNVLWYREKLSQLSFRRSLHFQTLLKVLIELRTPVCDFPRRKGGRQY